MRSTPLLDDRATEIVIDDDDELDDEPRQKLSFARLGIVLLVAALMAGAVVFGIDKVSTGHVTLARSWSVPYVDVTLTPTYEFQNPESNPARDIALAFVVADPESKCEPSWGGSYSMDAAKDTIELDRRITQLRAAGGDIMVSFGGQANTELAVACTNLPALTDAYRSVIERYNPQVIDLDIEGSAVADSAATQRRAEAIAAIQRERADAKHPLAVWLTVPVTSGGLAADAVSLVTSTIKGGVALTGVNVMTMNFGSASSPTADMLGAAKSALEATAKQVAAVYATQGVTLDESQRWAHLGATPMIGQNDVEGEVFTIDDAKGLASFAVSKGLGRVSLWSLNRDTPCSASFADVMVLSNVCSSVKQDPLGFASVFTSLPGRAAYLPQSDSVTMNNRQQIVDDPTKSPYPLWRPEAQYPEGYKVVRHGLVYQAKWYTQGQEPTLVTTNPWDTPWSLVGPVGPDDQPFTPTTVAAGTYPDWNPDHLYAKGDRVLLEGLPYEARWPNQSEVPQTLLPVAIDSAWNPLYTVPGEPSTS